MESRLLSQSQASCSLSDFNVKQHLHLQRGCLVPLYAIKRRVHSSRGHVPGKASGIRHAARCKCSPETVARRSSQDANACPNASSSTKEEARWKGKSTGDLSYVAITRLLSAWQGSSLSSWT